MTEVCNVCGRKPAMICIDCHGKNSQGRRREFKRKIFSERKACEMCGVSDIGCLTIHHENGRGSNSFNESTVKVLCMNCHFGKVHRQEMGD